MKEFINPLNFTPKINEPDIPKQHGVNIVDFETVCYDKANFEQGRSLSLNFCKYRKILEPSDPLESAKIIDESLELRKNGIGEKELDQSLGNNGIIEKKKVVGSYNRYLSKNTLCSPIGWMVLTWMLIISLFVVHVIIDDRIKGICFNIDPLFGPFYTLLAEVCIFQSLIFQLNRSKRAWRTIGT